MGRRRECGCIKGSGSSRTLNSGTKGSTNPNKAGSNDGKNWESSLRWLRGHGKKGKSSESRSSLHFENSRKIVAGVVVQKIKNGGLVYLRYLPSGSLTWGEEWSQNKGEYHHPFIDRLLVSYVHSG